MTALVTGASGFLGGRVTRHFQEHGYRVIAAGRRAEALPEGAERFVGDLAALAQAGLHADVVVHCAALSSSWGPWREFERSNVTGTRHALEAARRAGAGRFVHISSPSIYAAPRDQLNIAEHEFDPRSRLNHYIRSKIAAEELLRTERRADDPEIVVLRPRGIIGAGDPSLAPRLLRAHERIGIPLFNGGRNLTDLTSVHNVAEAVRLAAVTLGIGGEVFNITNGDPRPFRELADRLIEVKRLAPRYRELPRRPAYWAGGALEAAYRLVPGSPEPALTRYTVSTLAWTQTLDISHARATLGYRPEVSVERALEEYADA